MALAFSFSEENNFILKIQSLQVKKSEQKANQATFLANRGH